MAKVERISNPVFGSHAVHRKEHAEDSSERQKQDAEQRHDDANQHQDADKKTVEKAVADLRAAENFSRTGMGVEMVETKDGLTVRLIHPGGATIRTMSGEEFLRLRQNSSGDGILRGKILDQKL